MDSNFEWSYCLTDCDSLGWDLDHTIIRYKVKELSEMIFYSFQRYLVEHSGYSKEVLNFEFDFDFSKKGIVLDREKGNILKLNSKSQVVVKNRNLFLKEKRGFHGRKELSLDDLKKVYGGQLLTNFDGNSSGRYWSMTTYFESPASSLFRDLVELDDKNKGHPENLNIYNRDYSAHAEAIYNAMFFNYAQWDKGYFFREICNYPEKYLYKQPHVKNWLIELKTVHKKFLFLLTNSLPEYTDMLMQYSFGADWTKLFDFVSVHAKKPIFFTNEYPYYEFEMVPHEPTIYPGPSYPALKILPNEGPNLFLGGNYKILENSIQKALKIEKRPNIVYFGDHLRNDIQVAKIKVNWKTVAIVEELEDAEKEMKFFVETPKIEVSSRDDGLTNAHHPTNNKYWGSFFTASETAFSFWGEELASHADLYVPSLERLCMFSGDQVFSWNGVPASINIRDLLSLQKKRE